MMTRLQRARDAYSLLQKAGRRPSDKLLSDKELKLHAKRLIEEAKDLVGEEVLSLIAELKERRLKACKIAAAVSVDAGSMSRLAKGDVSSLSLDSLLRTLEGLRGLWREELLRSIVRFVRPSAELLGWHGPPDVTRPKPTEAVDVLCENLLLALHHEKPTLKRIGERVTGCSFVLTIDGHWILISYVCPSDDVNEMADVADHELWHCGKFVSARRETRNPPEKPRSAYSNS
jgi:hypothetical protein